MDNKQYRKIRRLFILSILLIGIVCILMVFLITKPRDVQTNYYVGQDGATPYIQDNYWYIKGINTNVKAVGEDSVSTIIQKETTKEVPVNGKDGKTPIKGVDYFDGQNGTNGVDGRQILIQVDSETCELQTKYEGDRFWQVIAQLPKPCEVEK